MVPVMEQTDFNNRVETFLAKTGMAPATFGREALNDPNFVARMRNGARSWPETQKRCLNFINEVLKDADNPTEAA